MKNDYESLSTPLIEAQAADNPPSRRTFCLCAFLLGLLVGFLTQKNDLSCRFLIFLFHHVSNPLWLCAAHATFTTLQLLVFLILLRATVLTEQSIVDLDRFFGMGSIVGVALSWMVGGAGSELSILFVAGVSLATFQSLIWLCGGTVDEEEETKDGKSKEYTVILV